MKVSVIIPVGPGHEKIAQDAIESVKNQTHYDVECIVVNDCGADLSEAQIRSDRRNVAYARNIGIQAASGDAFVCLDADDVLHKQYVEKTLQVYAEDRWVYTDYLFEPEEGVREQRASHDWDVETLWRSGVTFVTCLYPKVAWRTVGGFDETIGHEDWEFHLRLASIGFMGVHLCEPLMTYRHWLGQRSVQQQTDRSRSMIQNRYPLSSLSPGETVEKDGEWPVLVYTGKSKREIIINGRELSYKVNEQNNVLSVHPKDVPYFMGMGIFRRAEKGDLQPINEEILLHSLSLSNAL